MKHFDAFKNLLAAHYPARFDDRSGLGLAPEARTLLAFTQALIAVRGSMDNTARTNVRW